MKDFLTQHWAGIIFGGLYVGTAVIFTMPAPGDPRPIGQKLYQWAYDALHLLGNRAIDKHPALQTPEKPAQP